MATTEEEQMIFWRKESHNNITRIMMQLDGIGKHLINEDYSYATLSRLLPELETISEKLYSYNRD